MNVENLKKWTAALRSGKYAQTKETLKDNKGFCCWGVMCDISGMGEWEKVVYDVGVSSFSYGKEVGVGMPPLNVSEHFLGIGVVAVTVCDREDDRLTLDTLNDTGEFTFAQLADLIDAHANGWDLSITVRSF